MWCGVLWRVVSCQVQSWLLHVVASGVGLWYVVVFTLRGVVRRCIVLCCAALCFGTWRAPGVTSIVVLLRCVTFGYVVWCGALLRGVVLCGIMVRGFVRFFLFVFVLRCVFCGAELCRGAWYCVSSCGVELCHVVSCGVVSCRAVW